MFCIKDTLTILFLARSLLRNEKAEMADRLKENEVFKNQAQQELDKLKDDNGIISKTNELLKSKLELHKEINKDQNLKREVGTLKRKYDSYYILYEKALEEIKKMAKFLNAFGMNLNV